MSRGECIVGLGPQRCYHSCLQTQVSALIKILSSLRGCYECCYSTGQHVQTPSCLCAEPVLSGPLYVSLCTPLRSIKEIITLSQELRSTCVQSGGFAFFFSCERHKLPSVLSWLFLSLSCGTEQLGPVVLCCPLVLEVDQDE